MTGQKGDAKSRRAGRAAADGSASPRGRESKLASLRQRFAKRPSASHGRPSRRTARGPGNRRMMAPTDYHVTWESGAVDFRRVASDVGARCIGRSRQPLAAYIAVRTSRRLWPMRLATATTGRASLRKTIHSAVPARGRQGVSATIFWIATAHEPSALGHVFATTRKRRWAVGKRSGYGTWMRECPSRVDSSCPLLPFPRGGRPGWGDEFWHVVR